MYRIFCIAKYELLADMRDSKFGLFWNFASPAIQVFTYWLVFGIGLQRKGYDGIPYLPWVIVGFAAWWYISPCITHGCSAVFSKKNVITKMKFPISVLPATVCVKEFFQPSVHAGHHSIHGYSFRLLSFHSLAWSDLFCLLRFYVR